MSKLDSIQNIVRVMNFHALARIDKAKINSARAMETEELLEDTIRQIYYNKNLNIDKKLLKENPSGVNLNIYIGSDLSFCGDFNTSILNELARDNDSEKIIVGQKIFRVSNKPYIYAISKEDFYKDSSYISNIIDKYLAKKKAKSINIVYNRYYSIDDIRLEKMQIFPVELEMKEGDNYDIDFVIENDANNVLRNILAEYLNFKVRIAEKSSWAAENVNRERIARESMKRIDELKDEERIRENQKQREEDLAEQIDNFERLRWRHA